MTTDYRALCAELLQLEQEQPAEYTDWKRRYNAAIARVRTALAQPEPVALTDEELTDMAEFYIEDNGLLGLHNAGEFARAVLARWGTPANALPTPEAANA
jgi:hypothetical protein